jgi:opacity protein-like surface antigen
VALALLDIAATVAMRFKRAKEQLMKSRMILAGATLGTLFSTSVFAEDTGISASSDEPRMRVQAQVELLPVGSGKGTISGVSTTNDTATAYGISGTFDYAINRYLSIGVSPRLVFNVKPDDNEGDDADKQLDLRAHVLAHVAVAPRVELYAALTPGYTFVLSGTDGVDNATGFALGGAAGVTYDLSPKMFVGAEVGYQRAFTSTDIMVAGQSVSGDLDLSFMHVGIGAGTRF